MANYWFNFSYHRTYKWNFNRLFTYGS
jgi:hypothetical protein